MDLGFSSECGYSSLRRGLRPGDRGRVAFGLLGVVTDGECVSELVEWFFEFAALGLSMIALGVFFTLVMEFSWTAGLRPEGYLEAGCGWLGPAFQNLGTLVGTSEVYRVRSHCLRTG